MRVEIVAQAIWAMANSTWNLEGEDAVPGRCRPEQDPFPLVSLWSRFASCGHSRPNKEPSNSSIKTVLAACFEAGASKN